MSNDLWDDHDFITRAGEILMAAEPYYNEPHRHYHNFWHPVKMLLEYTHIPKRITMHVPSNGIALAIAFHDAVYIPGYKHNEKASAILLDTIAPKLDFITPEDLVIAKHAIMATKSHDASSVESDLVVDLDLLGFAPSSSLYRENTPELIREEFVYVNDADFKNGRFNALMKFHGRTPFYFTDYYESKYGDEARKAVRDEIVSLDLDMANRWLESKEGK